MYTTIKNTSSFPCFGGLDSPASDIFFKQGKAGQGSADLAVIAASWGPGT